MNTLSIKQTLANKKNAKKGQSLAEYGLILGLIAVLAIGALTALGGKIQATMTAISAAMTGVTGQVTAANGANGG